MRNTYTIPLNGMDYNGSYYSGRTVHELTVVYRLVPNNLVLLPRKPWEWTFKNDSFKGVFICVYPDETLNEPNS